MKKTIIIIGVFLFALSIVTASGQGIISFGGLGFAFFAAPFARAQGSSAAVSTAAQATTTKKPAQVQNTDLQNALQKQQQTLQMLSNISKTLNDTAKATIRKIGG